MSVEENELNHTEMDLSYCKNIVTVHIKLYLAVYLIHKNLTWELQGTVGYKVEGDMNMAWHTLGHQNL